MNSLSVLASYVEHYMDMDIQKTYFYKNIYHNANPDHDEEDANSESTTFCCCYTKKKSFVHSSHSAIIIYSLNMTFSFHANVISVV